MVRDTAPAVRPLFMPRPADFFQPESTPAPGRRRRPWVAPGKREIPVRYVFLDIAKTLR